MKTVYILIGYMGSGKSTWASDFVKDHPDTKIVCPDVFRRMLNGQYEYIAGMDDMIDKMVRYSIKTLIHNDYNVIVDACNLMTERRHGWILPELQVRLAGVVFERKDSSWHLQNRSKNPHCDKTDLERLIQSDIAHFEPIDETKFDNLIYVKVWYDGNSD